MESPRFFLESPIILPHGYALPAVPYCPLACISIELPCSSCYCFRLSVISSVSFSTSGSSISKSSAICTGDQPFANFLATKFFNVAIRPCFSPSFSPFSRPSFNPSSRPSFRPSSYSALRISFSSLSSSYLPWKVLKTHDVILPRWEYPKVCVNLQTDVR